jgi:hypothetical protein
MRGLGSISKASCGRLRRTQGSECHSNAEICSREASARQYHEGIDVSSESCRKTVRIFLPPITRTLRAKNPSYAILFSRDDTFVACTKSRLNKHCLADMEITTQHRVETPTLFGRQRVSTVQSHQPYFRYLGVAGPEHVEFVQGGRGSMVGCRPGYLSVPAEFKANKHDRRDDSCRSDDLRQLIDCNQ